MKNKRSVPFSAIFVTVIMVIIIIAVSVLLALVVAGELDIVLGAYYYAT